MPHRVIEGRADFAAFMDAIGGLDVVIATDSGTAHLCSLTKPVLSIFGASPWRRYAPFGRENVVITRNLACSPCVQFDMKVVNACMSRECVVALDPEFPAAIVSAAAGALPRWRNMIVARGTSHMADE
jgi:ADP-heptose:LPS heptosyltransferase